MGSNNKSHVKIINNDGTPVTTTTPLPVDATVDNTGVEALLTSILGRLEVDANNNLKVTLIDNDDVSMDFDDQAPVGGGVAHDAADSDTGTTGPVKIGAKAIATLSGATLVAAADRTNLYADLDGVQITRDNSCIGDYVSGVNSNTDGTSTELIAAGAAGVKHAITDITIINTSASMIYVELKDNTTVKWRFPVPATGGVTHRFQTPLVGTAATAWNFDPSAATTTVYCSASGFKTKV
jgi:hypothetical protein